MLKGCLKSAMDSLQNDPVLEKLYKIANILNKYDSVAEGWRYNKEDMTYQRFLAERDQIEKLRATPRSEPLHEFNQNYYNMALMIYRETIGDDCPKPLPIP